MSKLRIAKQPGAGFVELFDAVFSEANEVNFTGEKCGKMSGPI